MPNAVTVKVPVWPVSDEKYTLSVEAVIAVVEPTAPPVESEFQLAVMPFQLPVAEVPVLSVAPLTSQ